MRIFLVIGWIGLSFLSAAFDETNVGIFNIGEMCFGGGVLCGWEFFKTFRFV